MEFLRIDQNQIFELKQKYTVRRSNARLERLSQRHTYGVFPSLRLRLRKESAESDHVYLEATDVRGRA